MSGVELIARERQRQISIEGFTYDHDDEHDEGELAAAAVAYAIAPDRAYYVHEFERGRGYTINEIWPSQWSGEWDKRGVLRNIDRTQPIPTTSMHERIRNLVKAGALIAAEIDRLHRKQQEEI